MSRCFRKVAIFYIAAIFIYCSSALASSNYCRGIIFSGNDTIKGFIEQKTDEAMSKGIWFRKSMSTGAQNYLPSDIDGFILLPRGIYFRSMQTPLSAGYEGKQLFALVLVQGHASLYKLQSNNSDNIKFYFCTKPDTSQDIVEIFPLSEPFFGKYSADYQANYKESLKAISADCPQLLNKLELIDFNDDDLRQIISNYNQVIHPDKLSKTFPSSTTAEIRLAVLSSATFGRLPRDIDYHTAPGIGLCADIRFPNSYEWFSLITEIRYEYAKLEYIQSERHLVENNHMLRFPFQSSFRLNSTWPIEPFFRIGAVFDAVYNQLQIDGKSKVYRDGRNVQLTYDVLFLLAVGAYYKRCTFSASVYLKNIIHYVDDWGPRYVHFNLSLGWVVLDK